jgi:hypothetical protein
VEAEEEVVEEEPEINFTDTFSQRGPPGGGKLVRDGAPKRPASGPPSKGPPGVDPAPVEEEEEEGGMQILQPIARPVLQPVAKETRKVLEPMEAERRILTPIDVSADDSEEDAPKVSTLKPVGRAVLKPVKSSVSHEEE